MKHLILVLACSFALPTWASLNNSREHRSIQSDQEWMLPSYLLLAEQEPARLIALAHNQFSAETLRQAKASPSAAFAWQDRMALLGALSQLFNPEAEIKATASELRQHQTRAAELIRQTLMQDTSLLVRDGAVETIRRIIRMQPDRAQEWGGALESAFMDRKNVLDGEGLFIRETLLTAMRESGLALSPRIRHAAEADRNPKVKSLLRLWSTRSFDSL